MYKRVLVPVDDSATSALALKEATQIVKESGGILRLVHIVDLAQFGWGGGEFLDTSNYQANAREAGQKILNNINQELINKGIKTECALLESFGDKLSEMLIDEAKQWDADLIAMGTHGWSELMQFLLGSVAEGVLRNSHIPVLLVRANPKESE